MYKFVFLPLRSLTLANLFTKILFASSLPFALHISHLCGTWSHCVFLTLCPARSLCGVHCRCETWVWCVCVCVWFPAAAVPTLHLFMSHRSGVDGLRALQGPTLTLAAWPSRPLSRTQTHTHQHLTHKTGQVIYTLLPICLIVTYSNFKRLKRILELCLHILKNY